MPSPIAEHLADRFASDARALRARQQALTAPQGAASRGAARGGPTPAQLGQMIEACERVERLFAGAESDDAVRALLPTLAGLVAGARNEPERAVYAGAVSRATQSLDGDPDEGDDEDDEDGDAMEGPPSRRGADA